jgi:hypothetical protein
MKASFSRLVTACVLFLIPCSANATDYVVCESDGDHYRTCSVPSSVDLRDASVRVVSRFSKSACNEGFSWGVNSGRNEIWVKNGCRARFAVDYDRYGSNRHSFDWDPHNRYERHDSYDRFNPHSRYDDYDRTSRTERELSYQRERLEKERLQLERERLERERSRLDLERQNAAQHSAQRANDNICPPGSRPGRCSDKDRKHGCRDWRIPSGLGCRSN